MSFFAGTVYGISSTYDKAYQFGYDEGYKHGAKVALTKPPKQTSKDVRK